jgi:hypothetical protein
MKEQIPNYDPEEVFRDISIYFWITSTLDKMNVGELGPI